MSDHRSIEVASTIRLGCPTRAAGLALALLLSGVMGCGESGTISVSKETRARLVSDADANGEVILPKTKNPKRPAVGLKTARGILDKKSGD